MTQFHILLSKHTHARGPYRSTAAPYAIHSAPATRRKWWAEPPRKTGEIKGFKQRHFALHIWIFSITPRWQERVGGGGSGGCGGGVGSDTSSITHGINFKGALADQRLVNCSDEWGFTKRETQLMTLGLLAVSVAVRACQHHRQSEYFLSSLKFHSLQPSVFSLHRSSLTRQCCCSLTPSSRGLPLVS